MRKITWVLVSIVAGCVMAGQKRRVMSGEPPAAAAGPARVSILGIPLDGVTEVVFVIDRSISMGQVALGKSRQELGIERDEALAAEILVAEANVLTEKMFVPTKMDAVQAAVIDALYALPDGTKFNVAFFDEDLRMLDDHLLALDPETRRSAVAFIVRMDPGTMVGKIIAGLGPVYRQGARRVVLMSDGMSNECINKDDIYSEARSRARAGVRFDVVGLGLNQEDRVLRDLAAEGGGMFVTR